MKERKEKSIKELAEYEEEKIKELYGWWQEKQPEGKLPYLFDAYREGYKQAEMGTVIGELLYHISGIAEEDEENCQ
jgi:hypothetical protein